MVNPLHCGRNWWIVLLWGSSLPVFQAEGWGRVGHKTVADIAWIHLSSEAKAWLCKVLDNDNNNHTKALYNRALPSNNGQLNFAYYNDKKNFTSPLAEVSIWADDIRQLWAYKWTTPLHYVNIHRSPSSMSDTSSSSSLECPVLSIECQFVYEIDCPNDICVVGGIANYTSQMSGTHGGMDSSSLFDKGFPGMTAKASVRRRDIVKNEEEPWRKDSSIGGKLRRTSAHWIDDPIKLGLYMVTHLVGDVHQPLHVSRAEDLGGNAIEVYFPTHAPKEEDEKLQLRKTNLHSVWDDDMIERALVERHDNDRNNFTATLLNKLENGVYSKDEQAKWLISPNNCKPVLHSSPFEYYKCLSSVWASESLELALYLAYVDENLNEITDDVAVHNVDDQQYRQIPNIGTKRGINVDTTLKATAILSPSNMNLRSRHQNVATMERDLVLDNGKTSDFALPILSEEYYKTRMEVVEKRLLQGGLRLAYIIDHVAAVSSLRKPL